MSNPGQLQALKRILALTEEHDVDYPARHLLVLRALVLATDLGFPAGVRVDPEHPRCPAAYITLPTGQVSWNLVQFPDPPDGSSTTEKYRRIRAFAEESR